MDDSSIVNAYAIISAAIVVVTIIGSVLIYFILNLLKPYIFKKETAHVVSTFRDGGELYFGKYIISNTGWNLKDGVFSNDEVKINLDELVGLRLKKLYGEYKKEKINKVVKC